VLLVHVRHPIVMKVHNEQLNDFNPYKLAHCLQIDILTQVMQLLIGHPMHVYVLWLYRSGDGQICPLKHKNL
jgi:hypothetical protein